MLNQTESPSADLVINHTHSNGIPKQELDIEMEPMDVEMAPAETNNANPDHNNHDHSSPSHEHRSSPDADQLSPVDHHHQSPSSSSSSSSTGLLDDHHPHQSPTAQFSPLLLPLTCKKCPGGRTFATLDELNTHSANTHRERPQYLCNQCGASFCVKRELATHARTHSGEQPHQCVQCGKEFGTRQLLKKHMMWHNGERTHVCATCGKAFFQKGHLTQHLMIHTATRPHECGLCNKTFIFKFDLNRHLKIHRERGFVCKQCDARFDNQLALDEHRRESPGGKCALGNNENRKSFNRRRSSIKSDGSLFNKNTSVHNEHHQEEKPFEPIASHNLAYFNNLSSGAILKNEDAEIEKADGYDHQLQEQQQLAIGRAFEQLLAVQQLQQQQQKKLNVQTEFVAQQQQQHQQYFPCLLCPQKFANQAAYLLHWSCAHLSQNANNNGTTEENKPLAQNLMAYQQQQQQQQQQLLLNLIKENEPAQAADDNTSYSSSSPPKVSPPILPLPSSSSSSSVMDEQHCPSSSSSSSSSTSSMHPSQQQYSPNTNFVFPSAPCVNCELEARRRELYARELAETRTEVDRMRAMLLRFGAFFGLINNSNAGHAVAANDHGNGYGSC